ncbi:Uncharacterized protein HZ326_21664 [Fusarium oxysporum f. sp. albedinis]|nr:Uncharacterized protein HZ326_21664 [Fusarium oxysporum f. sp. albedinis]
MLFLYTVVVPLVRTRDPVRSPIDKLIRGELVVGSVTTSESSLLYVFSFAVSVNFLLRGKVGPLEGCSEAMVG